MIFKLLSYCLCMFCIFWGSTPRWGPQKSYFFPIPGHIFVYIILTFLCIPGQAALSFPQSLKFEPCHKHLLEERLADSAKKLFGWHLWLVTFASWETTP